MIFESFFLFLTLNYCRAIGIFWLCSRYLSTVLGRPGSMLWPCSSCFEFELKPNPYLDYRFSVEHWHVLDFESQNKVSTSTGGLPCLNFRKKTLNSHPYITTTQSILLLCGNCMQMEFIWIIIMIQKKQSFLRPRKSVTQNTFSNDV